MNRRRRPGTPSVPVVVCVDDEPQILGALSRLLRREPYELRTTTDPGEALEWVRTGRVSLLISDYRMPGISGTSLLQLAEALSPRTARLMLTGYPGETPRLGAGQPELIAKPWDDETLKKAIRERVARPPGPAQRLRR